jgi:FkbM family methyltransferase
MTWIAIKLGPQNPLVRSMLARSCRAHGASLIVSKNSVNIVKGDRVMKIATWHFAYAPDMASHFDVYFNAVVAVPGPEGLVVDYSRPGVHRYASSGLEFELSAFPEEEEVITEYFQWYRPSAGDRVFDLGAHCGVSTYYLAQSVGPSGSVIAFEPDPICHGLLLRNIKRHGLDNVIVVKKAISGISGTANFMSEGTIGSSPASNSSRTTMGSVVTVETTSLADACRDYGVPVFVKMDIEGAELEAVAAAKGLLKEHPIHLCVDTNHWVDGELTADRVEAMFNDFGYDASSLIISGCSTTFARPRSQG